MKKLLLILLVACTTLPAFKIQPQPEAKKLFETHCIRCHGADGHKSILGAGKLFKSKLDDITIIDRIQNGKRMMPSFKAKLKEDEIKALAEYIKTLRTSGN